MPVFAQWGPCRQTGRAEADLLPSKNITLQKVYRLQILELKTFTKDQVLIRPNTAPGKKIAKMKGDRWLPRLWGEGSHTALCPHTASQSEVLLPSTALGDCLCLPLVTMEGWILASGFGSSPHTPTHSSGHQGSWQVHWQPSRA